ncbi:MAG: M28 family peptidase [Cyanobacteria bacterium J06560_2]
MAFTRSEIIERLTAYLQSLGGPRDPFLASGSHRFAQEYIRSTLATWGDVTAEGFDSRGKEYYNWQLVLEGQRPQLPPFLVGAHYDTVPGSPGADDNASGVAAMLVLAEMFSQQPSQRTIHFVAFDLEEYGLVGSTTCARRWRSQNKPLHLMLSLEMLGYFSNQPNSQKYPLDLLGKIYPSQGNFIALIGNAKTIPTMQKIKRCLKRADAPCQWLPVINGGKQVPPTRYSDHSPFWDQGYSALMVTDTAHLRNPHYHTTSDKIETLDLPKMANITQGLADYLAKG